MSWTEFAAEPRKIDCGGGGVDPEEKSFAAWCLRSRQARKRICAEVFPEQKEVHHMRKVNIEMNIRTVRYVLN